MAKIVNEDPSLLTVPQAAEEAEVSQTAIRSAVDRKRLPAIVLYGRVLIKRADFDAWKKDRPKKGRPKKQTGEESR